MRWLIFLLIGILLYRLLLRATRKDTARPDADRRSERMVSCSRCNLNIPESEALVSDGRYFCTRQHLESWTRPR